MFAQAFEMYLNQIEMYKYQKCEERKQKQHNIQVHIIYNIW